MSKRHYIKEYLYIILGTFIAGCGIALFDTPARIAAGGVNGIGTILFHTFGWDPGVVMLILNIPLFIIGMKVFGPLYGAKSLVGTLLFSGWVSLIGLVTDYRGILPMEDDLQILLAAIFGGALMGCGLALVMRTGANTGGTDILVQILNKYTPFNLGTGMLLVDGVIIAAGAFAFGIERALIAVISVYIASRMINYIVMTIGTKYAKTAYIISDKHDAISRRIISELHHGGTLIPGTGIFTRSPRGVLLTVVHNREIYKLTEIVHDEDPMAFVFVHEAYQVLGEGFVPMSRFVEKVEKTENRRSTWKYRKQS
ncbi:protein of unknown function DUF161 [Parasphaerochaeta coccoides DSM 17374]|uniref:DUF2179 domain-containing protein n=1 Tax=Parasphaerochaeta coccoides (strain ATCC BAA-1237 / DSM 17374 / SPN1) TaxID=760011 RepID=F4GL55_PARC1|nr:YitT family protein [Parasphaerochaeta coccoides]AEC02395.1 protein of unknown function DUF161 [Parasphaerochaeta coccoides DSM 17374]